jgi:hypothetical protein
MKRVKIEPGSIRIRGVARGIPYPSEKDGYKNIPAWSRGASPYKQLSPFIIGPVIHGDERAENFENFWQSHKVWPNGIGFSAKPHVTGTENHPNEE